jgi:hypothetical protein
MRCSNLEILNIFFIFGFQLLKILQKFGNIEKFDFLYHTKGPSHQHLQPKGFAFVQYKSVSILEISQIYQLICILFFVWED